MNPTRPLRRRARRRRAVTAAGIALGTVTAGIALQLPASASAAPPQAQVRIVDRTLIVEGGRAADVIALRVRAAAPQVLDVDLGDDGVPETVVSRSDFDKISVRAGAGNDDIRVEDDSIPFTDTTPTAVKGQAGDDTATGGSGAETFDGGTGSDVVDGNRGNDRAVLGDGDDEFIWDPGDGSDVIEGRGGHDLMTFNGAGVNETFTLTPNGGRLRFTRNVANIVMDTGDLEQVDVNTLGGSDFVDVNDLRGTDVVTLRVDQAPALGGAGGDGIVDHVTVEGSPQDDTIGLTGSAGSVSLTGTTPAVEIANAEPFDTLTVVSGAGRDTVDASTLAASTVALSILTGSGRDVVEGSAGTDSILSGEGNDIVDGNQGNDDAALDIGDDEFIWDPGDGSDIVAGERGDDVMTFNGSGASEIFVAMPIGDRLAFTRNVGNIFMDTVDVEGVDLRALGGADQLTVDDLTGTDVGEIVVDLAGVLGGTGGDGQVDSMTVNGTGGDDDIVVAGSNGSVDVTGLASTVAIRNAEPSDQLTINSLGGADTIDDSALAAGTIGFTFN